MILAGLLRLFYPLRRMMLASHLLILSLHMQPVLGGNDGFVLGPRSMGMGQIGTLQSDIWSVHNNPGALGWLERSAGGLFYENRFQAGAFAQTGFAAALKPGKKGAWGVGASRFGSDLFAQTRASAAWGMAFGLASLGLQIQYLQVTAREVPSRGYLMLSFGGLAKLTDEVWFSGTVSNFTQTRATDYVEERLPTVVRGGLLYKPGPALLLGAEVEKDLDQPTRIKAGLEYEFRKNFRLRTGFTTGTLTATAGAGWVWRDLQLDVAVSHHPQLGWSQNLGIQYAFGKALARGKKEKEEDDK
jgi:hypothetical protein